MTAIQVTKNLPKIIHAGRHVRNGMVPSGELYGKVTSALNHANLYRKRLFGSYTGRRVTQTFPIFPTGTTGGPTPRFYWRNHVGHAVRALRFEVKLALSRGAANCRVRFAVTAVGGATTYSGYLTYGVTEGTPTDVPNEIATLTTTLDVDPDTTYNIVLLEYDYARPVQVLIWELGEDPDTGTNYYTPPGHPVGGNILDAHRADLLPAWTALMESNANAAWQWTVDETPLTRSSATYQNVHDQSSTAHSAASAGVTIDLTGHQSFGRTSVPYVFAVYAKSSAGVTGKAKLINAGGDVVAITNISAEGWWTATVNLATTEQKLDLLYGNNGVNTTSIWALSLYEFE
jgi:hypothetical protein